MMIAALLAASLVQSATFPARKSSHSAAPCQAVPALCIASGGGVARPVIERSGPAADNKMSAYRFNARPCRVIGNLDCPKQARLQLFRLGEPMRETLLRSLAPR